MSEQEILEFAALPPRQMNGPPTQKNLRFIFRRSRSCQQSGLANLDPSSLIRLYLHQLSKVPSLYQTETMLKEIETLCDSFPQPILDCLPTSVASLLRREKQNSRGSLKIDEIKWPSTLVSKTMLAYSLKELVFLYQKVSPLKEMYKSYFKLNPLDNPIFEGLRLVELQRLSRIVYSMKYQNILNQFASNLQGQESALNDRVKGVFKNFVALSKCELIQKSALIPVRCKLCEEMIELENMADHSFGCFERQMIYKEIAKINKLIVKLSTQSGKIRTKLLCPLKFVLNSPKRKRVSTKLGFQLEQGIRVSSPRFQEVDWNDSNMLDPFNFAQRNVKVNNLKHSIGFPQRSSTMEYQEDETIQAIEELTPQPRNSGGKSLESFSV